MEHQRQIRLLERLRAVADGGREAPIPPLADRLLPVESYVDPARCERERLLLRRLPVILGREDELAAPGSFFTHDHHGLPVVVTRDEAGRVRAFLNVCRHRGTRLVDEPCGQRKAFVCRYHGWSYRLGGELLHVPLAGELPDLDGAALALRELPVELRHGFVWARLTPGAPAPPFVADLLGEFDDDLASFGYASHRLYKRVVSRRPNNWKLVMDAFLEGYHVKSLHRDTIYRFFLERGSIVDRAGDCFRSVGGRRTLGEVLARPPEARRIADAATVFYLIFPNTVLVHHPDWISQITMYPLDAGTSIYTHAMLVPRAPSSDAERAHWEKSFALIEEGVFANEDLAVAASIQSTLESGANDHFTLSALELPIRAFHDALDRAARDAATTPRW